MNSIIPIITITIGEEDCYTKICGYTIDKLCPQSKPFRRPYNNSKDAKALQYKYGEISGCSLQSHDAIRFYYDPTQGKAILSINKGKIVFDNGCDFANIFCVLSGNYGFYKEIQIPLAKKRCNCVSLDCADIYLNEGESKKLSVKVSSSIDLDFLTIFCNNKSETLNSLVSGDDYSVQLQEVKYLSGNISRSVCYEIQAVSEWTIPVCKTVNVYFNPIEWIDNDEACTKLDRVNVILYKNGGEQLNTVRLLNHGQEPLTNVIVEASDTNCVQIDRHGAFSLMPQQPFSISFKIDSLEFVGNEEVVLFAKQVESGYVSKCLVMIETKEQIVPTFKLTFTSNKDENGDEIIYYVGQGSANVGKLSVECIKSDKNIPDCGYITIDLTQLKPLCTDYPDNLCFELSENYKEKCSLAVGEKIEYDVCLNMSEEFNEEDDTVDFNIQMGDSSKKIGIPISLQEESLSISEEKHNSPEYSKGQVSYQLYEMSLQYPPPGDDDYSKRKHNSGKLLLVGDDQLSFDSQAIVKEKTIDDILSWDKTNFVPVYFISPKEWGDLENLTDDRRIQKASIKYIETNEVNGPSRNLKETRIKKIDTSAQLEIYFFDKNQNEQIVFSEKNEVAIPTEEITIPTYRYDPNNSLNVEKDTCFSIWFRNTQKVKTPPNNVFIKDISIKKNGVFSVDSNEIIICNGDDDVELPISIDVEKLISRGYEAENATLSFDYSGLTESIELKFKIPIEKKTPDVWYSLDLGTSGIVVAKCIGNRNPEIVCLNDQENENLCIEKAEELLSSVTIIKPSQEDNQLGVLELAPTTMDLYSNTRILPCKFLAGRRDVPMKEYYMKLFPEGIRLGNDTRTWDAITTRDIISYTYKDVFSRMPDEVDDVSNLVITYPNTYTPLLIQELCDLINGKNTNGEQFFPNLKPTNLFMVPESDAVVAYYVNEKVLGDGFGDKDKQVIVVYDMGAGTLDLSRAVLEKDTDGKLNISINKRIGVPIGGAYVSDVIYKYIESQGKFQTIPENADDETKKGAIRDRSEFVDKLKRNWNTSYNADKEPVLAQGVTISGDSLYKECDELIKIVNLCANDIFKYLFESENWTECVDQVILSGRGSLLAPIKDLIMEKVGNERMCSIDRLKTCVAIGAILYQRILKDEYSPFRINHTNTHQNIGLSYCVYGKNFKKAKAYIEIIKSSDIYYKEEAGARFVYVKGQNNVPIDLSFPEDATLYLTPFNEKEMLEILDDPNDVRRSLITHLMTFSPSSIVRPNQVTIHINTDTEGTMTIKFNNQELKERQLVDKLEDNKYYLHYFNANQ